ncbi:TPA: hypothetical protein ENS27_16880 [bacterium]|nr:hypothetical protein [bacterium]
MESVEKQFTILSGNRILRILKRHNISAFPKIIGVNKKGLKYKIKFEWINGETIKYEELGKCFLKLGKIHKENKIKNSKIGYITICHGDFHIGNIIKSKDGEYIFIDLTYINKGWNFSDLEYIDFYNIYDKEKYPWMLKNNDLFDHYLEGAEIKLNKKERENVIQLITIKYLKKCIKNGIINKIPCNIEKRLLKDIMKNRSNLTNAST